jgi:hypothetical protein
MAKCAFDTDGETPYMQNARKPKTPLNAKRKITSAMWFSSKSRCMSLRISSIFFCILSSSSLALHLRPVDYSNMSIMLFNCTIRY